MMILASSVFLILHGIFFLFENYVSSLGHNPFNTTSCPDWLHRYAIFHRHKRENKEAKRLTYICEDSNASFVPDMRVHMPFQQTCAGKSCAGFGDRIRSMMWGLRIAAASERIFHISHTSGINLTDVLIPNLIDWRPLPGKEHDQPFLRPCIFVTSVQNHLGTPHAYGSKELFYGGNSQASRPLPIWVQNAAAFDVSEHFSRSDLSCVFNFLFRLSPRLEKKLNETLKELFGSESANYSALHIRGGELVGDKGVEMIDRGDQLDRLIVK